MCSAGHQPGRRRKYRLPRHVAPYSSPFSVGDCGAVLPAYRTDLSTLYRTMAPTRGQQKLSYTTAFRWVRSLVLFVFVHPSSYIPHLPAHLDYQGMQYRTLTWRISPVFVLQCTWTPYPSIDDIDSPSLPLCAMTR